MVDLPLQDLSRQLYVRSRVGRSVALRLAFRAYQASLNRAQFQSTPAATAELRERLEALFERDHRDAEEGLYPAALIGALPWRDFARAAPKLLLDLPRTRARIQAGRFDDLPEGAAEQYPRYYARNFHFQTDGYLGETSAQLYDLQVELLFGGSADAMRRRLIPPLVRLARETPGAPLRLLDVACGTGRLLGMLGAALPTAWFTGVDLSPHYVAHARSTLPRSLHLSLLVENAEALPFPAGHFDAISCCFLFHELPRTVRRRVLAEMARVVRPGGLVVLGDSLQLRDAPTLERELQAFPSDYHEPYYLDYLNDDLAARAAEAGLVPLSQESWFLTKVVVVRKETR